LDTIGVGKPVVALIGDSAGDHKGQRVLYGGRACQFAPEPPGIACTADDDRIRLKPKKIKKSSAIPRLLSCFFEFIVFLPSIIHSFIIQMFKM